MSTINSSFNKAESLVSVTLHRSAFSKNGENYGKVTRNTVTLENLIASIIEENRGLDPYMVQHSAVLLQQQILKMLQQGNAVNILDLGFMYIALKGTIKGDKPNAADLPNFAVKFTPSALANEALKTLQVDKVVLADTSPQINVISNTWTGSENTVTSGKTCRITGSRLKLGGDLFSVNFHQLNTDGSIDKTKAPVPVDPARITKNTPGILEFYVPEGLFTDASYSIAIETSFISKDQSRKQPVTAFSGPVTVEV